jgi:hypothetical protein
MFSSLGNIIEAFENRFNTLLECWRQQRLDTKLQLSCFAAGMFEKWYEEYYDPVRLDLPSAIDDTKLVEDEDNIRQPTDILVYALPPQPSTAKENGHGDQTNGEADADEEKDEDEVLPYHSP